MRRNPISPDLRDAVIERGAGRCHYCNRRGEGTETGPGAKPWNVDHKVPVSRGGTDDMDNLVLACARCNNEKHTRDYDEFSMFAKAAYWEPDGRLVQENLDMLLRIWSAIGNIGGSGGETDLIHTVEHPDGPAAMMNVELGITGPGGIFRKPGYSTAIRIDDCSPFDGAEQILRMAAWAYRMMPMLLVAAQQVLDDGSVERAHEGWRRRLTEFDSRESRAAA